MSSIDQRVVQMKFDNAAFQRGVADTLRSLEALNKGLNMPNAAKGLGGISAAANAQNASLKNVESSVSSLSQRFSSFGTIATGALLSVGARVQQLGSQMVSSFTFSPLTDGFREYETNLNSIQTILANTQAAGTNLKDVTNALDELNHYSDQTIYNFSEMAKNIGTFTAAGVALKPATAAIKGIANLAALSGSNSEQASGAMYQLSQAISSGRVSLEDWNSVVNAGMGGTVFQRALAMNAEKMGTLKDGAVKLSGEMKNVTIGGKSFRESITAKPGQESWLTSEVLTQTLSQFTGDLKDADLAAQGFSKSQIKAIQDQAKMAKSAATEVKTMTQLFGTFKEQLGSGWAQTWQIIFGDFAEAKGLFTGISNSIGGLLQKTSDARNKLLQDWDKLGGRKALIEGVTNVFKALWSVLTPIGKAFREIFPPTTAKQLFDLTTRFRDFTKNLIVGSETAGKIQRIFAGIFSVFGIGIDIVKGLAGVIGDLFGQATEGSGGLLDFLAKVGDFFKNLRVAIREGEGLKNFFAGLTAVLAVPIKLVQKLATFIGKLFNDVDGSAATKGVEQISKKLEPLGRTGELVSKVWDKVLNVMRNVGNFFQGVGNKIADVFTKIREKVSALTEGMDFQDLFAGINTGLFAGLVLILKNFAGGGAGGFLDGINDSIEGFTKTLGAMQGTLHAATLLQIAVAVGILALSMNTLSKIDAAGLTRAGVAISVMFTQLIGSLVVFQKFVSSAGYYKMPFVMGSLILLAAAVNILASAVTKLATLSWDELSKGLTGVTILLGGLVGALTLMPPTSGLISTGAGIVILAAGIKILASAAKDMSSLDWNELAKGLTGVGALLGALILFTMFSKANAGGIAQGAGIILLATGLKILASAVKDFADISWADLGKGLSGVAGGLALVGAALYLIPPTAPLSAAGVMIVAASLEMIGDAVKQYSKMNWGEIGKGLTVMAGALAAIALSLAFLPPTALLSAAAIFVVAASLKLIGNALKGMAEMSWGEIGKSLVLLAGSLGIIAIAMYAMTAALPGAAALLVVAASLAILAPIMKMFGEMSWGEIGKGLLMLAGVFVVIGAAGLLLAPVTPLIAALGIAVGILGVGMLAAGAGLFLFATGLSILAAAGVGATAAIVGIVGGLVGLIPVVVEQIGLGMIAFAKVIAKSGPAILEAITTVLLAFLGAIEKVTPKAVDLLLRMMVLLYNKLAQYVPKMVDAGMRLVAGILDGIAKNIGKVITKATDVAVAFLKGIGDNLPRIIQAGFDLIIKFIDGLTRAINSNSGRLGESGANLGKAIVSGMVKGIAGGIGSVTAAAGRLASAALSKAKSILDINSPSKEFEQIGKYVVEGFRRGLDGNRKDIDTAFYSLRDALKAMTKESAEDIDKLEAKLKKLQSARRKDVQAIKETKAELAQLRKEHKAYEAGYTELTKKLNDERTALGKLADKYDIVTNKLKKANETLANSIKTRDDYNKQIREQFSDQATPTGDIKAADYIENLKKQVENTKKFMNGLQRLRKLGLNDEVYKDLLSQGIDALPFVEDLLKGGKGQIDQLNKLGKELDTVGAALGKNASSALYDAAVNSAKGIVKGLQKEQANIEKQMDKIADAMVRSIKKKLGIKSPSVEMAKVGVFSMEGLVKGMEGMASDIEKSAIATGSVAMESLRKSLSGFSDLIVSEMDTRPTITPVLDLSSAKKDAGKIGGMLGAGTISVDAAYSKAKRASESYLRNQSISSQPTEQPTPVAPLTFNQYNNSPKALSSAEIYRQTKNQLSMAKGGTT